LVGSPRASIFSILLPHVGIYQAPQRRPPGCLTLADREEISCGLAAAESFAASLAGWAVPPRPSAGTSHPAELKQQDNALVVEDWT
jgi:hypothetical protein